VENNPEFIHPYMGLDEHSDPFYASLELETIRVLAEAVAQVLGKEFTGEEFDQMAQQIIKSQQRIRMEIDKQDGSP